MTITANTTNTAGEIQWYWMTGHGWITRHDGRVFDLRWTCNTIQGGTDGHIRALGHRIGSAPAGGA
jgi:hypothetical protein